MKGRTTNKNLESENAELRNKLEQQANATQTLVSQLSKVNPNSIVRSAELMVGIRCVSDNTLGLVAPFPGELPVQLFASTGRNDPGECAVISFAWWQQLRKSKFVREGMLIRDDSVLGSSYTAAPVDRAQDMPEGWEVNLVLDPDTWITSRTDDDIRAGIAAMTALSSIRRLRHAVDVKLTELQAKLAGDPDFAVKALESLPTKYALVDQLATARLDRDQLAPSQSERV